MNLPRPDLAAESAAAQGARAPETRAAALLRPPGTPPAPSGAPAPDHIVADPGHVVEPDGTEDPLANADDGLLPGQGADARSPRAPRSPLLQNPNPERSR
ncbi:hypothetical protein [Herbaspirillum huttiense]|uniref:hypothetical protein n=1 Tax=Herbaspirillum huttiense TaxID=863372 RepID=UPI00040C02C2|nr:hypothetical protein [Herbaspirillum huttiense]